MRRFIGDKPRVIATATYERFARKYGIAIGRKSIKSLSQAIYEHELKRGVSNGLYFRPK
jgi:hypothetical protein